MNREYILEKIINIVDEILDLKLEPHEELKDCGIDSLSIVTIIVSIEEEFDIVFNDTDLDPNKLITLNDVVTLVESYICDCGNI